MERPNIINYSALWDRIGKYARTAGRITTRPVLLLYYVMGSDETPWKDKLTIFGALAYLVFPVDLLDAKRLPIIGWLDEITSLAVAIQRMSKYITPEMEAEVDSILDRWFPIYTEFEEVIA
ncbi:MAG: DUF1232 domain-containing protein [Bacteroidaceae bacterium]|nr:DUF1232 domain-containing protein [Bacteroidaceae bacterium]